jgi:hypothetical protein
MDDRPERSLSDAILSAIGSLTVLYLAGQLVRQYVPQEALQSLLELLSEVPPVILVVILICEIVLFFVIILRMPMPLE